MKTAAQPQHPPLDHVSRLYSKPRRQIKDGTLHHMLHDAAKINQLLGLHVLYV